MSDATTDAPVSAYEKAPSDGSEVDPRCVPQVLDGDPPTGAEIAYPDYSQEDQDNWRFLFERQMAMLPGRAGAAYLRGVDTLGMTPDRIPALADLSEDAIRSALSLGAAAAAITVSRAGANPPWRSEIA